MTIIAACSAKKNVAETNTKEEIKQTANENLLKNDIAEGKSLYENNCAHCHKLYDPKQFSAEEWKPIMQRMQKNAQLTDEQGMKVYNYLTMK